MTSVARPKAPSVRNPRLRFGLVVRDRLSRGRAAFHGAVWLRIAAVRGLRAARQGPGSGAWKMDCAALVSLRNESTHCPRRGCVISVQNALRIGCPQGATHFQAEVNRSLQTGWGGRARGVAVMRGPPFSGFFMASALGGPFIDTGGTSRPLRECVGAGPRPSCSGGRKAGVGSGEVSLKMSSGASLPIDANPNLAAVT